jgi:hemolysin activation/secretion protein
VLLALIGRTVKRTRQGVARRPNFIYKIQCCGLAVAFLVVCVASAQQPQLPDQPPPDKNPEAEVEPTPIPGTEVVLMPQLPPSEKPLPGRTLKLGPPGVIEPILPPVNFEALGRSGRLWSFHGVVKEFRFVGNHVFSNGTLSKVVEKYSNREINADDIEQARQDLTLFYVSRGYVNSGAVVPDQDGKNGIITLQLVEGRLTGIKLKGNFWFRPWWLRNEIRRGAGRPLNFNKLKEALQLLRQNPTISRINAELQPGGVPGESILDVDIKDTQPFRFAIEFNNKRPPSVGAEILNAHATDLNLTGHNDTLDVLYGIAHSNSGHSFEDSDFSGADNIDGTYTFPVTPWATTLQIHASKSDTSIIEEPFTTLDINSKLEQYGATLRQPIYQTLSNEFAISITAEKRRSVTFLLGQRFSLSPGDVDGVAQVFVLRLAQEFVNRSQLHVLALRSTFNIGLDAFDATDSGMKPNWDFFSWLGQGQYIRRLWNTDNLLVARLNAQFSNSPLFNLEQFVLGGADSVRGYRENQILRDNGVFGSIEVRVPVLYGKEHTPILIVAPFVDLGTGWNTLHDNQTSTNNGTGSTSTSSDRQMETLTSTGLGLIANVTRHAHAEIYWGYGFNRGVITQHHNLQDYGIHFAVTLNAF